MKGGITGRPIEWVPMHDSCEPALCQANTVKLIEQGVFALGGDVGRRPVWPRSLPSSRRGFPLWGSSRARRVSVSFCPTSSTPAPATTVVSKTGEAAVVLQGQLTHRRFVQDDAYGAAIDKGVTQALAELGAKPVAAANANTASGATGVAMGSVCGARGQIELWRA